MQHRPYWAQPHFLARRGNFLLEGGKLVLYLVLEGRKLAVNLGRKLAESLSGKLTETWGDGRREPD